MSESVDGLRKKYESLYAEHKQTCETLAIYQSRLADLERERTLYLDSHAKLVREKRSVLPALPTVHNEFSAPFLLYAVCILLTAISVLLGILVLR